MRLFDLNTYGMPLRHRQRFWLWFLGAVVAETILLRKVPVLRQTEVLVAAVAGSFGFLYFLRQQHMEEAKFFRDLTIEFNVRYDSLNDWLLKLREETEKPFSPEDKQVFIDYFNLCAEEWLFYKAGYIYKPVWQAWRNGMKQFRDDPRVRSLWLSECKTESYYGFEFPVE